MHASAPDPPPPTRPSTAAELGFVATGLVDAAGTPIEWSRTVAGEPVEFRLLRGVDALLPAEHLQREVMGATELDVTPASELVVVEETGGDVLGAFTGGEAIGALVSWGGWVAGAPRLLSDLLAIRASARSRGLGAAMKTLQYAIAAERGFPEIVWTVDPLRAANARLNFEKLGAISHHYEINRYGDTYGAGLYGGMPTDRLHLRWRVGDPDVEARLHGRVAPLGPSDVEDLLHFDPAKPAAERALVYLPADIDRLLGEDRNAALRWRLALRETLQTAFAAGYTIRGFVAGVADGVSAFVIAR